jgi:hypothetical protein
MARVERVPEYSEADTVPYETWTALSFCVFCSDYFAFGRMQELYLDFCANGGSYSDVVHRLATEKPKIMHWDDYGISKLLTSQPDMVLGWDGGIQPFGAAYLVDDRYFSRVWEHVVGGLVSQIKVGTVDYVIGNPKEHCSAKLIFRL